MRLFGPYQGKLANEGDSVELVQPDIVRFDTTNIVTTSVLVDKVKYRDDFPWPAGADGLGFSLQRRVEFAYGNDPTNWVAASPTPGSPLGAAADPAILVSPMDQTVLPGATVTFNVEATGTPPLNYQWRYKGENLPGAEAQVLTLTNVQPAQSGEYEVVVSTTSRSTASAPAVLKVGIPPADCSVTPFHSTLAWGRSHLLRDGFGQCAVAVPVATERGSTGWRHRAFVAIALRRPRGRRCL